MPSQLPSLIAAQPKPAANELEVRSYSYEDRREILPALAEALAASGCWLHGRKATSLAQMEYHFDLPLRSAVDLYSGLVGCGLELTRDSHQELTGLCTLRRHNPRAQQLGRVIGIRLEVNFLEDVATQPAQSTGNA